MNIVPDEHQESHCLCDPFSPLTPRQWVHEVCRVVINEFGQDGEVEEFNAAITNVLRRYAPCKMSVARGALEVYEQMSA